MNHGSQAFFVLGTDTDVGKTLVASLLLSGYASQNASVHYWKPVQTGHSQSDEQQIRRLGIPQLKIVPTHWSYPLPASPDQAAVAAQSAAPTVAHLRQEFLAAKPLHPLIIEGAGGLEVPLNEANETWLDFLTVTSTPVLLVARSGLGTLNHTALTLHRLQANHIPVLGVVLSGPPHEENIKSLRRMFPQYAFYSLALVEFENSAAWSNQANALAHFVTASSKSLQQQQQISQSAWLQEDAKYCWHPYTQHKLAIPPLPIVKAQGVWLETATGDRLFDGSSSWWVNTIGHGRREIREAIGQQQAQLDHVLFAGTAHEGAATLASRLVAATGHQFAKVFYSDNGSTAVEVALKMVAQYWFNRGTPRTLFFDFTGSYHGDTFGAMSVGRSSGFHTAFEPLMFQTKTLTPVTAHPSAACPDGELSLEPNLQQLEQTFAAHAQKLAGVIIEPLVQGASGMNMQSHKWLQTLSALCHQHQIPLIFDEVFTGMGRLGTMSAAQRAQVSPDIICLAKGLTGGNMPLAVTLAKQHIFDAFYQDDKSKALLHGHSYTANPIACAAAIATLEIYEKDDILRNVHHIEAQFKKWITTEGQELQIVHPRTCGAILAFELPGTGVGQYFHPVAGRLPAIAQKHHLLLRPLGNTLYLVPPLVTTTEELDFALNHLSQTLRSCRESS